MVTFLSQPVWSNEAQFIGHSGMPWERVKRVRYTCLQRFQYDYPGMVYDLRQQLIISPDAQYGDQQLISADLYASPSADRTWQQRDRFGNTLWKVEIGAVEHAATFESVLVVERANTQAPLPAISPEAAKSLLAPTRLTTSDAHLNSLARGFVARCPNPLDRAEQISAWVADALKYGHGFTHVESTAIEALKIGRGLCQDYAHIMLVLCRAAHLPARYVSGHMLGEGGSHAWVEVILADPTDGMLRPVAFDPTNRRRPNLGYTTIATGRDYRDVPPTSGSFIASFGGQLSYSKHAGLTLVEFNDGEIVSV